MTERATPETGVERKRARPAPPKKKPGQRNKVSRATISKDIRLQVLTALNFVGGVQFLVRQARKQNNAPFMALLAKCLMQDDGSDQGGVKFVIQQVSINAQPVPGVLNSPVPEHVQPVRLIANGGEVVDLEPTK